MDIKPVDIKNASFKRKWMGYDPVEVNSFLEAVADDMQSLLMEIGELKRGNEELKNENNRMQEIEDSLKKALVVAEQSANQIIENAKNEANTIRERAKVDYLATKRNALLERDRLNEEIRQLKNKRWEVLQSLKGEVEYFLKIITREVDSIEGRDGEIKQND